MSTIEWRWLDIDGTAHAVGFDELSAMLTAGELPSQILVWHTGLFAWHPASAVPELAALAGGGAPKPPLPSNPARTMLPAPPLNAYAALGPSKLSTLRQKTSDRPSGVPMPQRRFALPKPAAPTPGVPAPVRVGRPGAHPGPPLPPSRRALSPPGGVVRPFNQTLQGVVPPPPAFLPGADAPPPAPGPIPIRDVMPTLAEEEPTHSPTLRPVAAVAPPPRAMPTPKPPAFESDPDIDVDQMAPTEPLPPVQAIATPLPPAPAAASTAAPAKIASPIPSTPPMEKPTAPRAAGAARAPMARRNAPATIAGIPRQVFTIATGIGFLLPGTVLLVAALMKPRSGASSQTEAAASASATASAATAAPRPLAGCTLDKSATRLAETAFLQVPLLVASAADGKRAAVGFAFEKDRAGGLLVDAATLEATGAFDQRVTGGILGVVPMTASGEPSFVVDEANPQFASARTIDGAERFTLGVTAEGLVKRAGDTVTAVWPGKSENPVITTPRVAALAGTGYAVTFRHGGPEGKILFGWLDDHGGKRSELKAVGTDAAVAGTPTVSTNGTSALVAFAAKATADAPYRVELAVVPAGGAPGRSRVFALPPGGPSGEGISPSSEGLSNNRFLLQWTEGSAGNRAVRAQVVAADLDPIGEPITLSAPDQNAGQGALWVGKAGALAFFLVKKDATSELWGASLRCP